MFSSTIRMDTYIGLSIITLLVLYILNRESTYSLQKRLYELETHIDAKTMGNVSVGKEDDSVVIDMDKQRYVNVLEPPLSRNMYM